VQGSDFSLTCESSGNPYPTITWIMSGASFASNAQQNGNVLRILNARPENNGVYVCQATNNAGSDQAATVIEIEGMAVSYEIRN
jgi:Immunoglobulin domain